MESSTLVTRSPEQLLEQELHYFQEIVDETQDLIKEVNNNSASSLFRLLESRDHWIDEIKSHEQLRKQCDTAHNSARLNYMSRQISDLAKALVVTDARLLDVLQVHKINIVKEIEKIVDIKNRSVQSSRRNQVPRIIDTLAR